MQRTRVLAVLAAVGASTIYGLNHTVAKGLIPGFISPFGLVFMRVAGAAAIFWMISIFLPREKIERKDWKRLLLCASTGMMINMLFFLKGLSLSTPINSSVIVTLSPVFVMLLSALILREKITRLKTAGIVIGMSGALALVLYGASEAGSATNIPLGNLMFLGSAVSFAVYLIYSKSLADKYQPITMMKWLFTIAVFINLPFTIGGVTEVQWGSLPFEAIWRLVFVVVGTTALANLLNFFALKRLKASTLGVFMYLQPLIGIIYAIAIGADHMSSVKLVAGGLVFTGVYLVTKKPKPRRKRKLKRGRIRVALGR